MARSLDGVFMLYPGIYNVPNSHEIPTKALVICPPRCHVELSHAGESRHRHAEIYYRREQR